MKKFSFTAQVFLKSDLIVQVLYKSTFKSLKYWLKFQNFSPQTQETYNLIRIRQDAAMDCTRWWQKGLLFKVFISLLFHFYHKLKLNSASLCKSLAKGCGLSVNLYFYNINVLNPLLPLTSCEKIQLHFISKSKHHSKLQVLYIFYDLNQNSQSSC